MRSQIQGLQRDASEARKTPEPTSPPANAEMQVLRVLEEQNLDTQSAVKVSEERGILKDSQGDVEKLVAREESTAAAAGSAEKSGICFPSNDELRRVLSNRLRQERLLAEREALTRKLLATYEAIGVREFSTVEAKKGETLQLISMRSFGTTRRWPELFLLNSALQNWDSLKAGDVVRVPEIDPKSHCRAN